MYQIDFMTCTAIDVIRRSAICHPSLFAERMESIRAMHARYAIETTNQDASRIAHEMARDCVAIIAAIESGNLDSIAAKTGRLVIAFGAAADLNLVPRSIRGDIIERKPAN